jgi:uncharacterized SAM-binding protein YcdF (DUF218 family)
MEILGAKPKIEAMTSIREHRRSGLALAARLLRIGGRLTAWALALFVGGFLVFAGLIAAAKPRTAERAEGIVVLTGGKERISAALKLLSRGYAKRLLISGVNPSTSRFQLIRLNPQNAALFRCCIDLDKVAENTSGNAVETARWTRRHGFKSLIVVTSSYHMPRSLIELRRELPDVTLIAHPVTPSGFEGEKWWTDASSFRILASEYVKIIPSLARYLMSRLTQPDDDASLAAACLDKAGLEKC